MCVICDIVLYYLTYSSKNWRISRTFSIFTMQRFSETESFTLRAKKYNLLSNLIDSMENSNAVMDNI